MDFFVRLSHCHRERSDSTQLIAILTIKPEITNKLVHLLQDLNSQSINCCEALLKVDLKQKGTEENRKEKEEQCWP